MKTKIVIFTAFALLVVPGLINNPVFAQEDFYTVVGKVYVDMNNNNDFDLTQDIPIPNQTFIGYLRKTPTGTNLSSHLGNKTELDGTYRVFGSISENDGTAVFTPQETATPALGYSQIVKIYDAVGPLAATGITSFKDANNSIYGVYFKGKDKVVHADFLIKNIQPLTVSCTASPEGTVPLTNLGGSVNFTASATGLFGNYTYSWTGDVSGTTANISKTFTTAGTKTANVRVTDTKTGKIVDASCTKVITTTMTLPSPSPSAVIAPSPSPSVAVSPSPSPSPSASPARKKGDVDSDNDVDDNDYLEVREMFARNDISAPRVKRADLNGNGVVDIYDYNEVVSNFNK